MHQQKVLHSSIKNEVIRCERLYKRLSSELITLPKGTISMDRHGNLCRCVRENGRQYRIILPPYEARLIEELKKRRYINKSLKILKARIENCRRFLEKDSLYDPKQIEKNLPGPYKGTRGLGLFLDGDIDPQEWANAPYRRNPSPIKKAHYTAGGIIVRSKSEAIIGTRLEERKAIFHAEPEVILGRRRVYPDFEALNMKRRKVMYLEHLGMIDDEDYVFRNLEKLQDYAKYGIILGDNLFITYESENRPLQIRDVDAVLDEMLG